MNMKEKLTIIKVGGKIVEEEDSLCQLLTAFTAVEGHKILVHGGGRSATKVAAQLGIESQMINGRRVTDADMLNVVTMVYGGLVNKNIVVRLQAQGVNALGLTGADMDVIRSHKRPVKDVDYGDAEDDDSLIPHINESEFKRYVEEGIIQGGMIPKLENSFEAIHAGVSKVIITLATAIDGVSGTVIER